MEVNFSSDKIVTISGTVDLHIICFECGDVLDCVEGRKEDVFRIHPCKKCLDKRYFEGVDEGKKHE